MLHLTGKVRSVFKKEIISKGKEYTFNLLQLEEVSGNGKVFFRDVNIKDDRVSYYETLIDTEVVIPVYYRLSAKDDKAYINFMESI